MLSSRVITTALILGICCNHVQSFTFVPGVRPNTHSTTIATVSRTEARTAIQLQLFRQKNKKSNDNDAEFLQSTTTYEEGKEMTETPFDIDEDEEEDDDDDNDDDGNENQIKNKKKETLKFGGKYSYKSQVYKYPSSSFDAEQLYNFFDQKSVQHIILSGGTNSTIHEIPKEEVNNNNNSNNNDGHDLVTKWNDQVNTIEGAATPDPSIDSVFVVTPPGIELITVSIVPTTTVGMKLIKVDNSLFDGKGLVQVPTPEFQATLIKDEPRAIGPKFFVWLFNKITYGGNPDEEDTNGNDNNNRKETAFLRVYVEPVKVEDGANNDDDDDDDMINFVIIAESSMLLEFEFPKLLLRFFPMKKDTTEKLCSEAIYKALEKNMLPAMDKLCGELTKYMK